MSPKKSEMEKHDLHITPLEENILLALIGRWMYSQTLTKALSEALGKKFTFGSIYPTLRRLEERGLIDGRWGDEGPKERHGPRRRYFMTNSLGEHALIERAVQRRRLAPEWTPQLEGG